MARKRIVMTSNKDLYNKLNLLFFSDNVVVKGVSTHQINKILNNVNKHSNVLDAENIGEYFVLKKVGPLNFSVYFNRKKR